MSPANYLQIYGVNDELMMQCPLWVLKFHWEEKTQPLWYPGQGLILLRGNLFFLLILFSFINFLNESSNSPVRNLMLPITQSILTCTIPFVGWRL